MQKTYDCSHGLRTSKHLAVIALAVTLLGGCATTETVTNIQSTQVASANIAYSGKKTPVVVGEFNNRSTYMQGLFSSGTDRLGNQSKTILKANLQQTRRFNVVDRESLKTLQAEAERLGLKQTIKGARYTITGDVTEFGRKVTGDKQFFGILGSGKKQVAYAKVTLNIVDVLTSEIAYSTQGAGEYALSNREVVGFGSSAAYDATLNGKVLNFAIQQAINTMVSDIDSGVWVIQQ